VSWLEKLRSWIGYEEPIPEPPDENEIVEANAILESAKLAVKEAESHTIEVQTVASSLASLRARNHFGEAIEQAMMPRGKRA
jgi:hypothetical protein